MMNEKRVKLQKQGERIYGPVVYWMQRDQRVDDNWALIFAQLKAAETNQPVVIIFCLTNSFLGATIRQYGFMLKGLKKVEEKLDALNISFKILIGNQEEVIPKFLKEIKAGILISDFSPLRIVREWKRNVIAKISIPFYTVDAHNIVPCWEASDKEEFGAYTLRPKIHKILPDYLEEFPKVTHQKINPFGKIINPWDNIPGALTISKDVKEVSWLAPGEKAAKEMMRNFFTNKYNSYYEERNDPNKNALSNLSPYIHFGHISTQRIALEVMDKKFEDDSKKSFLEELIIRRELADNFCFYNKNYDSFDGFKDWAKTTLNLHRKDKREYSYTRDEFENAATHDPLWNAAQKEMVTSGKMHGYMRMYWAKKILEWTKCPEDAIDIAIYLNDRYELDGRDSNGYAGIAWSIGGIHDRAWFERPVFGKIRYMNYNGCKRKFDVNQYIANWTAKNY
jgi:deoxyribodipyrimidine photo-lyase